MRLRSLSLLRLLNCPESNVSTSSGRAFFVLAIVPDELPSLPHAELAPQVHPADL